MKLKSKSKSKFNVRNLKLYKKIEKIENKKPYNIKDDEQFCLRYNIQHFYNPRINDDIDLSKYINAQSEAMHVALNRAHENKSTLLIGPTGTGKTYVAAGIAYYLRSCPILSKKYSQTQKDIEPRQIFIVTKNSIVKQIRLEINKLNLPEDQRIDVLSYDSLRSYLGTFYIEWRTIIIGGEPVLRPFWNKEEAPYVLICDECQALKNYDSQQAQIINAFSLLNDRITIFLSATPASKPNHTRVLAQAIQPLYTSYSGAKLRLTQQAFPSWIEQISAPASSEDFCPKAMSRIIDSFDNQVYRFRNIKWKCQCRIRHHIVPFQDAQTQQIYNEAFNEYQEIRSRQGYNKLNGVAQIFVALLKFRQISELLRAPILAKYIHDYVEKGYNVILGVSFQDTLKTVHSILISQYSYTPENISIIIGGQDTKERHQHVNRFQKEKTNIILVMFQAGYAGLSLHHHEKNNRPRRVLLPPVWSSEEFIQFLGRAHRINTQSTTYQHIIWYAGTVEERVMARCQQKTTSSKAVMGDTWASAYNDNQSDNDKDIDALLQKQLKNNNDTEEEETETDNSALLSNVVIDI